MKKEERINELLQACSTEKIEMEKDIHFIYSAIEVGVPPICCMTSAEWYWSSNMDLLNSLMSEVTLYSMISTICEFAEYTNHCTSTYELMCLIEENNPEMIINPNSFSKLKKYVYEFFTIDNNHSSDELVTCFEEMTILFNQLGINCSLKYFDCFDKAFSFLENNQYGGVIPVYDDLNKYFDGEDGSLL